MILRIKWYFIKCKGSISGLHRNLEIGIEMPSESQIVIHWGLIIFLCVFGTSLSEDLP